VRHASHLTITAPYAIAPTIRQRLEMKGLCSGIMALLAAVEEHIFPVRLIDCIDQPLPDFRVYRTEGAFCKLGIRERIRGCQIARPLDVVTVMMLTLSQRPGFHQDFERASLKRRIIDLLL
jgi:hypothetical protein